MAFLIPDNLKSRKDVPEGIRRVAQALQMGLADDATLWFEPPFDPTKQKPHFVLLAPDRGILVLELLELKSGSGFLGVLRSRIRVLRDSAEIEVESPLARAQRFAEVLRARIQSEPRLRGVQVPIAAGAVFHVISKAEAEAKGLASVVAPQHCLFREEIDAGLSGSGEAVLQRALVRLLGAEYHAPFDGEIEKLLRGVIQPEAVIDRADPRQSQQLVIFRPMEDGKDTIRVMDRKQEAFAKSLGEGHRLIRGVAGSGKTLLLVYRARLLSKLLPSERILVGCYTRSLAGQLRYALADCPNVDVKNLDSLMADFIRQAGFQHPGYGEDSSGDAVARLAVQALDKATKPRYRAVLLDEAQDFGSDALRFALGLLQQGSHDFILVADAAQNIFKKRFTPKSVGINAVGRTRILRTNYRNTREILEGARKFLLAGGDLREDAAPADEEEDVLIPPDAALRSGKVPSVMLCPSEDLEIQSIVRRVKEWLKERDAPRSVAILYATNDGRAFNLVQELRKQEVGVFWLSDPKDKAARDRIAVSREPVVMTTIQSAKGLEFPRVVLMGPPKEGQGSTDYRKLAYVGMTRATEELEVIMPAAHPFAWDFATAFKSGAA